MSRSADFKLCKQNSISLNYFDALLCSIASRIPVNTMSEVVNQESSDFF